MDRPAMDRPTGAGRYELKDGKLVLVEEPTRDHPEGNCARDEKGVPLPAPTKHDPAAEAPASASGKKSGATRKGAE